MRHRARVLLAAAGLALLACPAARAADDAPGPPKVELLVVPETDGVEPGKSLTFVVSIVNLSPVALEDVSLVAADGDIAVTLKQPTSPIPPFDGYWSQGTAQPKDTAAFGNHQLVLALRYNWHDGPRQGTSLQTATAAIQVRRRFAEEAQGLPGGTGALFSLLFPVIPAFLAFQIVDRLRKKEGFQIPTFSNEYIVPAFFVAIAVNALAFLPGVSQLRRLDDVSVRLGLGVLAGALWPGAHWLWDAWQWRRWGFRDTDTPAVYLRKALLSPWAPGRTTWVTGTAGRQVWSGLLLRQPDGSLVLGATLAVSHPQSPDATVWENAERLLARSNAEDRQGRRELTERIASGSLRVQAKAFPSTGDGKQDGQQVQQTGRIVVTGDEVAGFVRRFAERRDLLSHSQ